MKSRAIVRVKGIFVLSFLSSALSILARVSLATPQPPDIIMDIRDVAQGTDSNNHKIVKFSTWTVNQGAGPLELHQHSTQNPDGTYDVDQWVYDPDVPGGHTVHLAGTFMIVGGRLRFTDSADYFLKEVTSGNGVGGIVASNQKVSYCIIDSSKYNPNGGGPSSPQYTTCGPTMGVSVNWADIYPSTFSSQVILLDGVSNGTYWLENTGDPLNRLIESDDTNNTTRVMVTVNTGLTPEINVTGNVQSIPNNDSTPITADGTDFGNVAINSGSTTNTFTIQNSGNGSLSLTGVPMVAISGASDFSVSAQPTSPVMSGNSTTFQITFTPTNHGMRTATVTITNNDSNEGSYQFAIWGNASADEDGDGEDNLSESISGTDPTDPNSVIRTGKQLNISTRLEVQTNDNVGIGGFIINGTDPKLVVLRARGPSLAAANIPNPLQDPTLELHNSSGTIAFNDNWQSDSQAATVQSVGLAPSDSRESALARTLQPGQYTAIVRGSGNTTGVGLVEMYDLSPDSNSVLANISTRGFADTDDSVMIGGIIVGDGLGVNGDGSVKVLIRGIGPSLQNAGIQNPLQDPTLELHDGNGALITSNDNWKDTQQAEIQATGLAPSDDRESAILAVLTKGNYTAILRGKNNTTGVALIEAYKVQ